MHPNAQTLDTFYKAFAVLDSATMRSCYAPDAQFQDEVFTLKGRDEVAGMWDMLCSATRAKGLADWKLEYNGIEADATTGRAHWDAHYLFSATGRKVLNRIDARFTFTPDGLIATHRDSFNFWAWARQALGTLGLLLGWSPSLRSKVRKTADANLRKFLAR